jgi:hypothetical protein
LIVGLRAKFFARHNNKSAIVNPIDFIGDLVLVGSVILTAVAVIWLPMLRRRELARVAEQKSKLIFVELHGSCRFNPDGTARSETEFVLKRKTRPDREEADLEAFTVDGQSLGLLPALPGRELAKELASGRKIDVKIDLVSGATEQEPDYYIKLVLKRQSPQTGRRR